MEQKIGEWEWVGEPSIKDTTYKRSDSIITEQSIIVVRRRLIVGFALNAFSDVGDTELSVSAWSGGIAGGLTTFSPADANIDDSFITIDCIKDDPIPVANVPWFYQTQTWEAGRVLTDELV